jgi:hypothetical protein
MPLKNKRKRKEFCYRRKNNELGRIDENKTAQGSKMDYIEIAKT